MLKIGGEIMFYTEFAKYYDKIFPLKENTLNFLLQHLKKGHVLDVACATGNYAQALSQAGFKVTGFDLDTKMLEIAREKAVNESLKINYVESSMESFDFKVRYDHAFCIGNSLVHLENEHAIESFINGLYQSLNEDGVFIIQVINYDRILNHQIRSLPTIHNDPYHFERRYSFDGVHIHFDSALIVNQMVYKNTVSLYPVRPKALLTVLRRVGFKSVELYGSFNEEAFNPDQSVALIVKAKK